MPPLSTHRRQLVLAVQRWETRAQLRKSHHFAGIDWPKSASVGRTRSTSHFAQRARRQPPLRSLALGLSAPVMTQGCRRKGGLCLLSCPLQTPPDCNHQHATEASGGLLAIFAFLNYWSPLIICFCMICYYDTNKWAKRGLHVQMQSPAVEQD